MGAPLVLGPADGAALARLAATAIAGRLHATGGPDVRPPVSPALTGRGASFVTLEAEGALRGCIGTLEAVRPLYLDVIRNAVRAMADPRMAPVTLDDWPKLDVSVSVLTAPEPVPATTRAELLAALWQGVHGLIVTDGARRATFLPAVWEKLPEPDRFLDALLAKGGWTPPDWPDDLRAARYTAVEFHDRAPRGMP